MAKPKKLKIDFKKPRYILPVIVLPFCLFFTHIVNSWGGEKKQEQTLVKSDELNAEMPSASKEIKNKGLESKFAAMQQNYGRNTIDLTAVQQFDGGIGDTSVDLSNYSPEERAMILQQLKADSIRRETEKLKRQSLDIANQLQNPNSIQVPPAGNGFSAHMKEFNEIGQDDAMQKKLQSIFNSPDDNSVVKVDENENEDYGQTQLKVFREQMRIVDSMNTAAAAKSEKAANSNKVATKRFVPGQNRAVSHINTNMDKKIGYSSSNPSNTNTPVATNADVQILQSKVFNTVYAGSKTSNLGIPAIIDMDAKAIAASRIRLKVLKPFKAGNVVIERGAYLYAFVSGFGTQRVMLSVSHILHNNNSIPVSLSLYDNDGYIGLYVPGSVFREFTKDVGDQSTQGLSSITMSEEETTNLTKPLIAALFKSSSKAISEMIKKSKVRFKYNYIVYLVDTKQEENSSN